MRYPLLSRVEEEFRDCLKGLNLPKVLHKTAPVVAKELHHAPGQPIVIVIETK